LLFRTFKVLRIVPENDDQLAVVNVLYKNSTALEASPVLWVSLCASSWISGRLPPQSTNLLM
jgi:hypothetical protein